MTWWNPFSWRRAFTPRMTENGHSMRWVDESKPLSVYTTARDWAGEVVYAVRAINEACGRTVLLFPVAPIVELARLWDTDPKVSRWPRMSVLIGTFDGADKCHTIHETDKKGRVNSAKVVLKPHHQVPGNWQSVLLHELCHVLCLDHSASERSVMYYNQAVGGTLQPADVRGLREITK